MHILEVYTVTPEGLRLVKEISINGRISIIQAFRPRNATKDLLFLVTYRYNATILDCTYDSNDSDSAFRLITVAWGNIADSVGRPSESGALSAIAPDSSLVVLRLYEGLFKIISLWEDGDRSSEEITATNIKVDELSILDIKFLHRVEPNDLTLAVLYQDAIGRHVKTYRVSPHDKDLTAGIWSCESAESSAQTLLPVPQPLGGCVIIGQDTLVYHPAHNAGTSLSEYVAMEQAVFKSITVMCYTQISHDGSRFLVADFRGTLYMLVLVIDEEEGKVKDIRVELLGETTIPQSMQYLDNGVVFVGSRMGDSQLIRLTTEPVEDMERGCTNYFEVLETYTNLGPILDMCVVDTGQQQQHGQLVTCSNAFKEGSLRIIRSGVGINEAASIELKGIRELWSLRLGPGALSDLDSHLVLSFLGETRILKMVGEECEEVDIAAFSSSGQTLHMANMLAGEYSIQVTLTSLRIIRSSSYELISEWSPPTQRNISGARSNQTQVVVAAGATLYYLELKAEGKLKVVKEKLMSNEVACVDITPVSSGGEERADYIIVGLWTEFTVHVLRVPSLDTCYEECYGEAVIPRSVRQVVFEDAAYVLLTTGEGVLVYYRLELDTGVLYERKKISLATQPTTMTPFTKGGVLSVFACSERPTVIHSSHRRLLFSNVNLKAVSAVTPLNSESYRDCLALTNGELLLIGEVDQIQKIHIRTLPLRETPRRICAQDETNTFGVITMRHERVRGDGGVVTGGDAGGSAGQGGVAGGSDDVGGGVTSRTRVSASQMAPVMTRSDETNSCVQPPPIQSGSTFIPTADGSIREFQEQEMEVHNLVIIDQSSLEVKASHQFLRYEYAQAITSCKFTPSSSTASSSSTSATGEGGGSDDDIVYYIVGTGISPPDETEPRVGRLVLFRYRDGRLQFVSDTQVKGAVYSMVAFNGKLAVSVNSTVRLFEFIPGQGLRLECSNFNNIVSLYLKTRHNYLLVGDLMRSITLLVYRPVEGVLDEVARDHNPNWMSAVEFIDDEHYIGAENNFNLFVCRKRFSPAAQVDKEEEMSLEEVGFFHTGEFINTMRHGTLVMQQPGERCAPFTGSILIGCVGGTIAMVTQIPPTFYQLMLKLCNRLAQTINSPGKIQHDFWRSFASERKIEASTGFVDGDLVERYLDLSSEGQMKVMKGIEVEEGDGSKRECSHKEMVKIVEDLTRLH